MDEWPVINGLRYNSSAAVPESTGLVACTVTGEVRAGLDSAAWSGEDLDCSLSVLAATLIWTSGV